MLPVQPGTLSITECGANTFSLAAQILTTHCTGTSIPAKGRELQVGLSHSFKFRL